VLHLTLLSFVEVHKFYYRHHKNETDDEDAKKVKMMVKNQDRKIHPNLEKILVKGVQRVRHLLCDVIHRHPSDKEEGEKLTWILFYFIKSIKKSLESCDQSFNITAPFLKELLRHHLSEIEKTLGKDCRFEVPDGCLDSASHDALMQYFQEKLQHSYLLSQIEFSKKNYEEKVTPSLQIVKTRREKNITTLRSQMKKKEESDQAAQIKFETECFSQHQKYQQHEMERKQTMMMLIAENKKKINDRWKDLHRSLLNDRSCWKVWNPPVIYFKSDKTENKYRMRLKLKRNYKGSDHKEASFYVARKVERKEAEKPATAAVDEDEIFKTLSRISITSSQQSSTVDSELGSFELEKNELEQNWFILEGAADFDRTKVQEKILFRTPCEEVNPLGPANGRFIVTATTIYFFARTSSSAAAALHSKRKLKDRHWPIDAIQDIQLRRYLLRKSAIEIFFSDQRSYLFNFPKGIRSQLVQILTKVASHLKHLDLSNDSPMDLVKKSGITQQWQRREISNFEYLMKLNTFAGRTFNDLTQYFVFPWILRDFTSQTLDLQDPSIYRDLSKPIGALNPVRLQRILERFEGFDDPLIPKFHYGTHYSSMGSVLYFLIRMEPFTTYFLENIQGGRFDIADRMFSSIDRSWNNCLQSPSDVNELIPEFYYQPEFLRNSNGFKFGAKQDGQVVDDVVLPPWASSPEEFIRIHREALESDYVSSHLHEWIDLIFGYKQRGPEAEKSHNLFYYLTYEGAVDLDTVTDPLQKQAMESQIAHFGQTPTQLFTSPHPTRQPLSLQYILFSSTTTTPSITSSFLPSPLPLHTYSFPPALLHLSPDELFALSPNGDYVSHRWNAELPPPPNTPLPFYFSEHSSSSIAAYLKEIIAPPFLLLGESNAVLFCSHFDFFIRVWDPRTSSIIHCMNHSFTPITFMVASPDNRYLIVASADSSAAIFDAQSKKGKPPKIARRPRANIRIHDRPLTTAALDSDVDIAVTASLDSTVAIHSLRKGIYTRSIAMEAPVEKILICPDNGELFFYVPLLKKIVSYTVNGRRKAELKLEEEVHCWTLSPDASQLILAGQHLNIYSTKDLSKTLSIPMHAPAKAIAMHNATVFILSSTTLLTVTLALSRRP
jgi:hypothetical protein